MEDRIAIILRQARNGRSLLTPPRAGAVRTLFAGFNLMATERFHNRTEAGRALGDALRPRFGGRGDLIVLALPRRGVPVGFEVARQFRAL